MTRLIALTVSTAIGIFAISAVPSHAATPNPLPSPPSGYQASFEAAFGGSHGGYANGQTFEGCFKGWTNASADDAFVTNLFDVLDAAASNSYFAANPKPITNYDHAVHSQILCIDGGISNDFVSTPNLCYWIDMLVNPVRWTEETTPDLAGDSHAGLYFDSNGVLTVYCATNLAPSTIKAWVPTSVTVDSNTWVRLTLKMVYDQSLALSGGHTFQVYANGAAISNDHAYAGPNSVGVNPPAGGKYFAMAESSATNISQIAFRNTGKLDDFVVTTNELISQITHIIAASATGGGTITPSGSVEIGDGFSQLFTFSGESVENIVIDGTTNAAASFYLFENVTTDHTIEVIFAASGGTTSNGVPHSWLAQFGIDQTDEGGDSNGDEDGSDATTEYYFGTDPTDPDSDATITRNWLLADGSQVLCWLGGTNGSAQPFQIWCSTNLSDAGAWTNIAVKATHASSGTNYWTNASPDARAFYEIRVPLNP